MRTQFVREFMEECQDIQQRTLSLAHASVTSADGLDHPLFDLPVSVRHSETLCLCVQNELAELKLKGYTIFTDYELIRQE